MFSRFKSLLNNRRLVLSILMHVWLGLFVYTYPRAVAAASFADDMRNFDYESIVWAMVTGLLGGFARTVVSLASDKMIVENIWREATKDAVVSIIAALAAYVSLEAVRAVYWPLLPSPARFAFILFAGASRVAFFGHINRFITRMMDAAIERTANTVREGGRLVEPNTPQQDFKRSNYTPVDAGVSADLNSRDRQDPLEKAVSGPTLTPEVVAVAQAIQAAAR